MSTPVDLKLHAEALALALKLYPEVVGEKNVLREIIAVEKTAGGAR